MPSRNGCVSALAGDPQERPEAQRRAEVQEVEDARAARAALADARGVAQRHGAPEVHEVERGQGTWSTRLAR